jgi:acetolactate synthase-1/2/3 large subunit
MSIRRRSRFIYGYPGGAITVYDELYKFKEQLHHVLVRTTSKVQRMLQGFARATGKLVWLSSDLSNQPSDGIADAQIDLAYGMHYGTSW